MMLHVTQVRVVGPYRVDLTFNDGERRTVNLENELWGEVFEPLRDPRLFAQVRVDPELGTIAWPNGAELAPEFLYFGEEGPPLGYYQASDDADGADQFAAPPC